MRLFYYSAVVLHEHSTSNVVAPQGRFMSCSAIVAEMYMTSKDLVPSTIFTKSSHPLESAWGGDNREGTPNFSSHLAGGF